MSLEKERIRKMLAEHKISAEDYKILLAALNAKHSKFNAIISLLINPFKKLAGLKAFIIGLVIILGMSYLGVTAKLYYSAVLDITNAAEVINPKVPLSFLVLLYQNLLAWILVVIFYTIAAKILQPKPTRIIDFAGTVALARFPYFLFTCLIWLVELIAPKVLAIDITKGYAHPSTLLIILGLIFSVCSIWQLATYYFAFKESSGLISKKLWIGFVGAMLISEIISLKLAAIVM